MAGTSDRLGGARLGKLLTAAEREEREACRDRATRLSAAAIRATRLSAAAIRAVVACGDDVLAAEPWRRTFLYYRAAAVSSAGELTGMPPLAYEKPT